VIVAARILIIEDNSDNLNLMVYLLTAFGHAPSVARSGEEGLVKARAEKPDLILCDIQLPGMDGYDFAQQSKADAVLREVPLLAVTALAMVGDRDKALAAGFDGYISKPIDPETFVGRLEDFLGIGHRLSPPVPAIASPVPRPTQTCRGTILVVDDLPTNLSLKRNILEPVGYKVITASGATEALRLASTANPDLILSDLNMLEGSGFGLIGAVKTNGRLRNIPFVLLTSTHCDETARSKGLALGAQRFLFRPLEPEQLLAEIEACLRERKGG
jgi:two-component system cell cycle response regulator